MSVNWTNLQEQFDKAVHLLEEESKQDPESEPYKSKYAARELFTSIKSDLKRIQEEEECENENNDPSKLKFLLAALDHYIGVVSIDTEELATGEEHLTACLDNLRGSEMRPECVLTALSSMNLLGVLYSKRDEPEKSRTFLERAEGSYVKYMLDCKKAPYAMRDLFVAERGERPEANYAKLESAYTHTLYYLAQVYGNVGEFDRAACYCHATLKRQLESKVFDPIEWSVNAATLSQHFVSRPEYRAARHHLACATQILAQFESDLASSENVDDADGKWEKLNQTKADVARYWAKYGQELLSASKDHLMKCADDDEVPDDERRHNEVEDDSTNKEETSPEKSEFGDDMIFRSLEVAALEEQVAADLVLVYDEAQLVFLNAQKWLNAAKAYYTLEAHASDNIDLTQELSQLYKFLAFFESQPDRQCKMHKRRIDMLEAVLKELNPQYYLDECRQIQFELGQIYSDMMDIKLAIVSDGESENVPHTLQKVNHLARQSIRCYTEFVDTFRDPQRNMPEKFPDEVVRPVLHAYFFMGRLHTKIVTQDVEQKAENLTRSVENYETMVNYCKRHEEAVPMMKEEFGVALEMVKLLPLKKEKILRGAF